MVGKDCLSIPATAALLLWLDLFSSTANVMISSTWPKHRSPKDSPNLLGCPEMGVPYDTSSLQRPMIWSELSVLAKMFFIRTCYLLPLIGILMHSTEEKKSSANLL